MSWPRASDVEHLREQLQRVSGGSRKASRTKLALAAAYAVRLGKEPVLEGDFLAHCKKARIAFTRINSSPSLRLVRALFPNVPASSQTRFAQLIDCAIGSKHSDYFVFKRILREGQDARF